MPPRRDQSVISRVVEQVRDTGSFIPGRREEEEAPGEMETGPNDEF